MDNLINIIKSFQFRNEFWTLILPIILMGADILTGFINAWGKKEISSSKLRTGLSKKVGEITILVIGELFSFALRLPAEIMTFISVYIILMELVSIFENLDKLGVPIPGSVKKVVNNAQGAIENADLEKLAAESLEVHGDEKDTGEQ